MRDTDWMVLSEQEEAMTLADYLARTDPTPPPPLTTLPPLATLPPLDDSWRDDAACKALPTEVAMRLFFPEPLGIPGRKGWHLDWEPARKVCEDCPVRTECADYAIDHCEPAGMWGGMSPRQRRTARERRGGARLRVCAICGCDFTAAGTAKYCDDTCRTTAARRRSLESKRRTA